MYTRFVRKPSNLEEILQMGQYEDSDKTYVEVQETIKLTAAQYDAFASNPTCGSYAYLDGKGGYKNAGMEYIRQAVLLKAKGRTTLVVDPSGGDYGRYVGLAL